MKNMTAAQLANKVLNNLLELNRLPIWDKPRDKSELLSLIYQHKLKKQMKELLKSKKS
jgi:hypothetical protein